MTLLHVGLIAVGYAAKAGLTYVLWRRYGPRTLAYVRLARAQRRAGRPVSRPVLVRSRRADARTFRAAPPARRRAAPAQQNDCVT